MFLLVFHMERRGLGMVLGCGSPPLLAVVGIGVSRETTLALRTHQTYVSRETSHPALRRPQQPTMFHVRRGETSSNTRETQPSPKTAKTRSTYPSK